MGKRLILIAAVLVGLALLLLGALGYVLPRWVESEEFQAGLRSRAATALGTGVDWDHAEIGLLPPRVILDSLELRGESEGSAEARLQAESVDLRLSLWPLLSQRIEMGSLVFRGVDLVVTRTDAGWIWPFKIGSSQSGLPSETAGEASSPPMPTGSTAAEQGVAGAVAVTLGQVRLADAQIMIRDRTIAREIDWLLSDLSFEANEQAESGRYALNFESSLAAGSTAMGSLGGEGELSLGSAGAFAFDVDLAGLRLEELVSYLPVATAEGVLSGQVVISGETAQVTNIEADLRAEELITRIAEIDLEGALSLKGVQRPGEVSDFEVGIDPSSGGHADIQGSRTQEGAIEAKAQLKELDSAVFKNLLGEARSVTGAIDGDLELSTRADGSISGFRVDAEVGNFGYLDTTHRLDSGVLNIDLTYQGESAGTQGARYALRSTLESARGNQTASGTRKIGGHLDATLDFTEADVAALPFEISIEALPTGLLTGVVTAKGELASQLSLASGTAPGEARAALDLAGDFKLDADMGATGPIALDARAALKDGGVIEAKGEATRQGSLDLNTRIESLGLAQFRPFLGQDDLNLGGTLSGSARVLGPAASPQQIDLDAQVADGALKSGEYQVDGPFGIELSVASPLTATRKGTANLDLTRARVLYEGRFEKKVGVPALLDAKFFPNAAGETEFESRLRLKNLEQIQIQGALGATRSFSLTATSLDLAQASEFVPALSSYQANGKASLSDFAIVQPPSAPIQFKGKMTLGGVAITMPQAGRVGLTGALVGDGNRLRTEALQVVAGDVQIELEGHLEDPFGEGRFSFSGRTVGTPEVNGLLSAFTSKRDTVFGPLRLEGDFSGAISEAASLAETVIGTLRFSVGEEVGGKLRGVSLLKAVLDQIPLFGSAVLSAPFRGGGSVEDFFSDEFEIIEGEFAIQQGAVEAKKLRLAYEGYEANLSGLMKLGDLSLDMTGELLLQSDLIAVLVGALGGDGTGRQPIQVPLARVSNTLSAPKVSMTPRTLVAIPKILLQATGLDRLKEGLQEGLGKILNPTRPILGGK